MLCVLEYVTEKMVYHSTDTNSVVRTYAHVGKRAHLGSTLTIGNNVNVPYDIVVENGRIING